MVLVSSCLVVVGFLYCCVCIVFGFGFLFSVFIIVLCYVVVLCIGVLPFDGARSLVNCLSVLVSASSV